jgi:hypothetical protein
MAIGSKIDRSAPVEHQREGSCRHFSLRSQTPIFGIPTRNFFNCVARCSGTPGRYRADHLSGMTAGRSPVHCAACLEAGRGSTRTLLRDRSKAASNPQPAYCYPDSSLGAFRRSMRGRILEGQDASVPNDESKTGSAPALVCEVGSRSAGPGSRAPSGIPSPEMKEAAG